MQRCWCWACRYCWSCEFESLFVSAMLLIVWLLGFVINKGPLGADFNSLTFFCVICLKLSYIRRMEFHTARFWKQNVNRNTSSQQNAVLDSPTVTKYIIWFYDFFQSFHIRLHCLFKLTHFKNLYPTFSLSKSWSYTTLRQGSMRHSRQLPIYISYLHSVCCIPSTYHIYFVVNDNRL